MSRSWRPTRSIAAADLFGGRLEEKIIEAQEVWESLRNMIPTMSKKPSAKFLKIFGTTERNRFLTDGKNVLSVLITERGSVFDITRSGDNDPNEILWAIDQEFEAGLIDEDDPDYWQGYEWREVRGDDDDQPK